MDAEINDHGVLPLSNELHPAKPPGDIDSICGIVEGTPLDMARDGRQIIEQATSALLTGGRD